MNKPLMDIFFIFNNELILGVCAKTLKAVIILGSVFFKNEF